MATMTAAARSAISGFTTSHHIARSPPATCLYSPHRNRRHTANLAAYNCASDGASLYLLGNTRAVFEQTYLDPMRIETPQPPELVEEDDGEDELT